MSHISSKAQSSSVTARATPPHLAGHHLSLGLGSTNDAQWVGEMFGGGPALDVQSETSRLVNLAAGVNKGLAHVRALNQTKLDQVLGSMEGIQVFSSSIVSESASEPARVYSVT